MSSDARLSPVCSKLWIVVFFCLSMLKLARPLVCYESDPVAAVIGRPLRQVNQIMVIANVTVSDAA